MHNLIQCSSVTYALAGPAQYNLTHSVCLSSLGLLQVQSKLQGIQEGILGDLWEPPGGDPGGFSGASVRDPGGS